MAIGSSGGTSEDPIYISCSRQLRMDQAAALCKMTSCCFRNFHGRVKDGAISRSKVDDWWGIGRSRSGEALGFGMMKERGASSRK